MVYKISVIIPVYNIEKYIGRCLESVINQLPAPESYEIIVVNDGSKDGSLAEVEKYKNQFPNLKIFTKPNGGLSSARNFGLAKATGEYVWFVDGDDWIAPDSMQKLQKILHDYPGIQIVEFDLVHALEKNNGFEYRKVADPTNISEKLESGRDYLADHGYSLGVTVNLYLREWLLNKNILFPEGKYSEDNIFSLKTTLSAETFLKTADELYFYFQRADSISHTKTEEHLKKYYDDIMLNIKEMISISKSENPRIRNKIDEMVAFFQLLIFLGLYKNRKFALAKSYARQMKADGLFPINKLGRINPKFEYFRRLVNLFYKFQ